MAITPVPIKPANVAGENHRAAQRWWRKNAFVARVDELRLTPRSTAVTDGKYRRVQSRWAERERKCRHRLRRPRFLTSHVAARHGSLLYREQRLASQPIEDEDVAHLRRLNQRRYGGARTSEIDEDRLSGHIIVP